MRHFREMAGEPITPVPKNSQRTTHRAGKTYAPQSASLPARQEITDYGSSKKLECSSHGRGQHPRIGDRSYWNLTKIPELPTSGVLAIEELHREGLVIASCREDSVEPTEAFWPWLEEVRQAEAQQAAAQQTNAAYPADKHSQTLILATYLYCRLHLPRE